MNKLRFATYNLHGLNNGIAYVHDLSNSVDILCVQEHWLPEKGIDQLNLINKHFVSYGISGMLDINENTVMHGRPYGGIAFLWKSELASNISVIGFDELHRCLAVQVTLDDYDLLCFGVYLPCYSATDDYETIVLQVIAFIESTILQHSDDRDCRIMIMGDFNFDLNRLSTSTRLSAFRGFINGIDVVACDNNLIVPGYTFRSPIGVCSFIDHFMCSASIAGDIVNIQIIDTGDNLSDHLPMVCDLTKVSVQKFDSANRKKNNTVHDNVVFIWDDVSAMVYKQLSRTMLNDLSVPLCECTGANCMHSDHRVAIDKYCTDIVNTLKASANQCVTQRRAQKTFWEPHLNDLKANSIKTHRDWVNAGKPRVGPVNDIRLKAKHDYKHAINACKKRFVSDSSLTLGKCIDARDQKAFWSLWKKRFVHTDLNVSLLGCSDYTEASEKLASNFVKNTSNSADSACYTKFVEMYEKYVGESSQLMSFSRENVHMAFLKLHLNKAGGLDGLTGNHLKHASDSLIDHITCLFNLCLKHACVPYNFTVSKIVPVLKNGLLDKACVDSYRPVSLCSILSKWFELCILAKSEKCFVCDGLQYGFVKGKGTQKALLTVRAVIDYYNNQDTPVYVASLDASKAFDKINHYGLFIRLMQRGAPLPILNVLINWHLRLSGVIKWGDAISEKVRFLSGIRQGGILSGMCFNIYVNPLITKLRESGYGCKLLNEFVGCILYADDILLVSASLFKLQCMLSICNEFGIEWQISFNCKKSHLCAFGVKSMPKSCLYLGLTAVMWCDSFQYLGVTLIGGRHLSVDVDCNRKKFLATAYAILNRCGGLSEEVLMQLITKQCVPILLYGVECFNLSSQQKSKLSVALNSVIRRIYHLNRWTSVREYLFYNGIYPMVLMLEERFWVLASNCLYDPVLLACKSCLVYDKSFTGCIGDMMSKSEIKLNMFRYAQTYCRIE